MVLRDLTFSRSSRRSHNEDIQARDELRRSISREPGAIDDVGGVREDAFVRVVYVLNPQLSSVYKATHNPG
jgi:hypothetical protein